jgi:hypothetical protein
MLNYVLPVAASIYALLQLAKDWRAHQTPRRRVAAFILILLVGLGTAVNNYYSSQRAAKQHADDQSEIKSLKTAVETAKQAQEANTTQFLAAFGKLSADVRDLQTQVTTEKLQQKLMGVQTELEKTQKALAPGPRAELSFTFVPFSNTAGQPLAIVTDKTLPLSTDGTVHVEFAIVNPTDTDAVDVEANFQICDECRYGKEPDGLTKLAGLRDTVRYLFIPDLLAKSVYKTLSVEVIPPPLVQSFLVGISYRCHSCTIPKQASTGMVHIMR